MAERIVSATATVLICVAVAGIAALAQVAGDVDCDGVVSDDERERLIDVLYEAGACAGADTNRDGRVGAADFVGLVHGPRITFIGFTSPDGRVARSIGDLPGGESVYFFNSGFGFNLVVEAAPGPSGAPVGLTVMDHVPDQPERRGDLQAVVDRNLGDGASVVCDGTRGVPAVNPESFAFTQPISNAINDLACRFAVATTPTSTCTQNEFGQAGFVGVGSRAQYCLRVDGFVGFPNGDTRITVQVRDRNGAFSPVRRLVVRVGSGPPPPTFTATATATDTPLPTATATRPPTLTPSMTRTPTTPRTPTPTDPPSTPTRSRTPTTPGNSRTPTRTSGASDTPTRTFTRTPTNTRGASNTPTRTPTRTPTGTRSPSSTPTYTRTRTPTNLIRTQTPTNTPTRTRTPAPGSPTNTPTRTRTFTPSRTFTRTNTPTLAVATATITRTRTPSFTPSPTSSVPLGPVITFFGLATASDLVIEPSGEVDGVPLYTRPFGSGFSIVVEAAPGLGARPVLLSTFNPFGSSDFQIQVTRPLGNGSAVVCDNNAPILGGVPAINPPVFSSEQSITDIVNDLSCRFVDGQNNTVGRRCSGGDPCLIMPSGGFGCANTTSTTQFCGLISQNLAFAAGDTTVSVRVRDSRGDFGPVARIVVRVE